MGTQPCTGGGSSQRTFLLSPSEARKGPEQHAPQTQLPWSCSHQATKATPLHHPGHSRFDLFGLWLMRKGTHVLTHVPDPAPTTLTSAVPFNSLHLWNRRYCPHLADEGIDSERTCSGLYSKWVSQD